MSQDQRKAKPRIAAIATLKMVETVMQGLLDEHTASPRIAVLYGPAGFGKSFCSNSIAIQTGAYYVQMRSVWRAKSLLQAILNETSERYSDSDNTAKLLEKASIKLAAARKPLIIDEFDHCVREQMIEVVRDIYEMARIPIIVIGEEMLPQKLSRWERFHSRVRSWVPAQPVSLADAELLRPIYCDAEIERAAMEQILAACGGSVRRVSVNFRQIDDEAKALGLDFVTVEHLKNISIYTGRSPEPRKL
jgi:hypothetical protein